MGQKEARSSKAESRAVGRGSRKPHTPNYLQKNKIKEEGKKPDGPKTYMSQVLKMFLGLTLHLNSQASCDQTFPLLYLRSLGRGGP